MTARFGSIYWDNKYRDGLTGWDIGEVSVPLKEYFDQIEDKQLSILIPGAGNAYEATYLLENGFTNTKVLDISQLATRKFLHEHPQFPENQLFNEDFFEHSGTYDLIVEQTFFCALDPELRSAYVRKVSSLLAKGGKLVGLLWDGPMNSDSPPFGGSAEEYTDLFDDKFDIDILEHAYNSIKPRAGRELFMKMFKK